jgi:hypothetical protein
LVNILEYRDPQRYRGLPFTIGPPGSPLLSTILQTAHFELLLGRRDPGYDYWIDVSLEVLKRCDAAKLAPE